MANPDETVEASPETLAELKAAALEATQAGASTGAPTDDERPKRAAARRASAGGTIRISVPEPRSDEPENSRHESNDHTTNGAQGELQAQGSTEVSVSSDAASEIPGSVSPPLPGDTDVARSIDSDIHVVEDDLITSHDVGDVNAGTATMATRGATAEAGYWQPSSRLATRVSAPGPAREQRGKDRALWIAGAILIAAVLMAAALFAAALAVSGDSDEPEVDADEEARLGLVVESANERAT